MRNTCAGILLNKTADSHHTHKKRLTVTNNTKRALLPFHEAKTLAPNLLRVVFKGHTKFQPDWSNHVGEFGNIQTVVQTDRETNRLLIMWYMAGSANYVVYGRIC